MKTGFENLPDLDEAFEAVKGQLFGPLDPALVKLKHKEIIIEAKEKREQEIFTLGARSAASDDHAERGRKDRDTQTRTLTWLLANDRAYREAHERAMASITNAGNAIDRAIAAGEKALDKARHQIDDYLRSTARLSDGRYVMIDNDGTYRDETGKPISADDVSAVEGQPIKEFKPYDELSGWKNDIECDLADLRGWSVEVGDMHNKATDVEAPASRDALDGMAERAERYQHQAEDTLARWSRETVMPDTQKHTFRQERTANIDIPKM